ncbi:MAG: c-type cytochrome [Thermoanaerobaculia bacterium]
MKTFLKLLGGVVALLVVLVAIGVAMLAMRKPKMRPASTEVVERTPERIARGKYIAEHVADCSGCHSGHVAERYGFPIQPGTEGQGGFVFDEKFQVPGVVCAQNITPDNETGLGRWTDGEVMRAFREGVNREGKALFPMMPYAYFRSMSDADARAVVAYLRTIRPIRNTVTAQKLKFPVNLLIRSAPEPLSGPVAMPDDSTDHLGHGKYLVTIAGCRECHTAHDGKGQRVPGGDYAGGWEMRGPWGRVVSANITPDGATFMGQATKEQFIGRIRSFASFDATTAPIAPKGRNTVMPWIAYAGMTDADLGAIFDYMKTVTPIRKQVVVFPDAPDAPLPPGAPAPVGAASKS